MPYLNIYHLDTKKFDDYKHGYGPVVLSHIPPPAFTTGGNEIVWQPAADDKDMYNKFFRSILDARSVSGKVLPAIVDIDEAKNLMFGSTAPRELGIFLAQARGAGIHVLSGTQEIAKCPRELISQATYHISFGLINKYDKSEAASVLGISSEDIRKLKPREFYFINTEISEEAKKYSSPFDILPFYQ